MRPISEDAAADYRQQEGEEKWRAFLERRAAMGGPDAPEPCEAKGCIEGKVARTVDDDGCFDWVECPYCLGKGVQP